MDKNEKLAGLAFLLLLGGLGLASLFIVLFAELAEEVMDQEVSLFDDFIINGIQASSSTTMDTIMFVFTEMGSVWFLTLSSIIILLVLGVKMKDKWGVLFFIIAVGGGSLLTLLLKNLYLRERPSINEEIDAIGYSFPSGHSMGSLIFYGFVMYLVIRTRQRPWIQWTAVTVLSLLIITIGTSRIYLGAHFPSDVLAGYIAGLIWLMLNLTALEWIQWHSKSPVPPVHALRQLLGPLYKTIRTKIPFFSK
ncbi:phosphoesterase PA-phosphatase related protein [Planococcus donghaensis MPA1U2]|uniref:Phosphoesterase PA-phosphatase related protein n=1 Tax=Planococcus donghaensis MPA1U2 TaxID=933115 RepID=E7REM2_9BACL|nr:phosphatase PAP2 family protein [Planococcus donghaensis]EGA90603.1 phosphoesterase PA-phosphatase related protein [Planococcus donghaensis MPA1U2]